MATLTIKNLPDEIHAALSRTAKRHRRSINSEAIVQLERALEIGGPEPDQALIKVRNTRGELRERGIWITDEILQRAKYEGRP